VDFTLERGKLKVAAKIHERHDPSTSGNSAFNSNTYGLRVSRPRPWKTYRRIVSG
jgi:hypothetical protein